MRPLRLLITINSLDPGGAERLVLQQLHQTPHTVRVVCLGRPGALAGVAESQGLEVVSLGESGPTDLRVVPTLRRMVRAWQPDLVHAHLPRSGVITRLALLGLGVPLVYTEHNTWDIYPTASRYLNRATFHLNSQVVAVSEAVDASIRGCQFSWSRTVPVRVIRNGIDCDRVTVSCLNRREARAFLRLSPEERVVGTVGNLLPRKGHRVLLRAATRSQDPYRVVIIGSGPEAEPIQDLADFLGIGDRLILVRGESEASRFLRAFDLFCLPSYFEGLPMALLEAMAAGVPCVATRVGGIPEVLNVPEVGSVVPPGEDAVLASEINRLLACPEVRQEMGKLASERVRQAFSIQRVRDEVEAVYHLVVDRV